MDFHNLEEIDLVQSQQFGRDAAFAAGAASSTVQRKLRKMSAHPEEPRVFSQAKILVPIGLLISIVMTPTMFYPINDYVEGRNDDIFSLIVPGVATLTGYVLLAYGLFRRFGVDRDKVWTRFGRLFYREVRFDEIDRFNIGVERYKLYVGKTLVNIDYNRFDYSLVYIRLLEELQYRRFRLPDADIHDPAWEDTAQVYRNAFAQQTYRSHRTFYDANPHELERLNALVQPPANYIN